jgi:hypothetical protein
MVANYSLLYKERGMSHKITEFKYKIGNKLNYCTLNPPVCQISKHFFYNWK